MDEKQYQANIQKANRVIEKLQQKIGQLEGAKALIESENEMLINYINSLDLDLDKDKEEEDE